MYNRVTLLGRLGGDPELRHTGGGTPVCNFSLATDRGVKRDGGWEKETTWHRVIVWGKSGEASAKHLAKGSLVMVDGRIDNREYEDREGNTKKITEVVANEVKFLPQGSGQGGSGGGGGRGRGSSSGGGVFKDDDIPF